MLFCYPTVYDGMNLDVSLLHVGREYNETGQMEEWWTQASVDNFIDRTLCYIEQYSDFNLFGIYVCIHEYSILMPTVQVGANKKQYTVHGVPMTDRE